MFAACVFALLCVASVRGDSTPSPSCEDLVHPLEHVHQHDLDGQWFLVAGSLSDDKEVANFTKRDTAFISFTYDNETSSSAFTRSFGFGGNCIHIHCDLKMENNSYVFEDLHLTVTMLKTNCTDCLVQRFEESNIISRLYLFSQRRQVEETEMDEFKAQVKCLNLPDPIVMDSSKDPCPVESGPAREERKKC